MFHINKILMNSASRNIELIRYYRHKKVANPGISHRREFLEESNFENIDEAEMEPLESDFMTVHKSYKEHFKDLAVEREQLKYHIVKQKYFKEYYPNFLTWNEKEQIKYLHSTNPEEWTIERLSESFPALPQIIKKVIKAKYTKNKAKIATHDEIVQKNWDSFKKSKLTNLPEHLISHLQKFTDRSTNFVPLAATNEKEEIVNKPTIPNVFSEIVTSYEALRNKEKIHSSTKEVNLNIKDLGIPENVTKSQPYHSITLSALRNTIENRIEQGSNISEDDKSLLKNVCALKQNSNMATLAKEIKDTQISEMKYQTNSKNFIQKSEKDYSHLVYPERIMIPKNKVKRDYVYKLNDCYYDYDGLFLYRVPGMD